MLASPKWLILAFVLFLFTSGIEANSKRAQPFKRVFTPQAPSIRVLRRETNPQTLVKRSTFAQDAAVLHSDTLLMRFSVDDEPVSVVLRPSRDLVSPVAKINYHSTDALGRKSVKSVPLLRQDFRAYEGMVVHEAHVNKWWKEEAAGLVRGDELKDERTRGWARITLRQQDDAWDGAMSIDGHLHHFKPLHSYLRDRSSLDPDPPISALARRGRPGGATIIARERDAFSDHEGHSCSHDTLDFNIDSHNPIYQSARQIAFDDALGFSKPQPQSWLGHILGEQPHPRSFRPSHHHKRQDIAGTTGNDGLNSTSGFVDSIGSTNGCPTDQRVLFIGVAADCTAVQSYGSQDEARQQILAEMNTVSGLYQRTFNVALGVVEMEVMDPSCPSSANADVAWNVPCGTNSVDLNTRLSLFSQWRGNKGGSDGAGLWHLLTNCNTGQEVGVAWLGQLCRVEASSSRGQTTSGTAVTALTDRTWTVIAHEIGHNFGAVHDCVSGCSGTTQGSQGGGQACCPLSRSNCDSGSEYIMSPVSTQDVSDFSPCSIGNVCSVLQSTLNTTCLYEPGQRATLSTQQCGNGILEPGEECDPGNDTGSSCCTSECKFTQGSVCDPVNSACCEDSCQFSPASKVCRAAVNAECDVAESCSGNSADCPADQTVDDGTTCGNPDDDLQCANGICTSRDQQCREQGDSLGITQACGDARSSCQLTCEAPGQPGCVVLDSNFADGTPCGGAGKCESGQCQRGAWQDEAASWITNNKQISIPVIVVAGLIVLAILYTCVRSCCRRSKRNRTAPSAAYNKRKSKKSKVAAIVPGVAAAGHHSNHNSPTNANGSYNHYAPPPQHPNAASYNNSQSSLMRETTPSNRNSFAQQPAFGAPNYPPPSGNYPGQSPSGFAAPAASYQPSYSNRSSAQYAAPSGLPPQQSSPLGWNPPQTQANTQGNWVDPAAYNGNRTDL